MLRLYDCRLKGFGQILAMLDDLLAYLNESPNAYFAVQATARRLNEAGFTQLHETEPWPRPLQGNFFVVRGETSIIAFRTADQVRRFHIFGAHTDSPHLKLKPDADYSKESYVQLGVEVYGGVLLSTWLDRDLSIAGRVYTTGKDGTSAHPVRFEQPLCRVSNLAIHLNPLVNQDGLILHRQNHLPPIIAQGDWSLDQLLSEEVGCRPEDILSYDLSLYDVQPATLSGANKEFIHSGRLDNLAMCHAGLSGLLAAGQKPGATVPVLALFDHEEVGSQSAVGAASSFLEAVLERIAEAEDGEAKRRVLAGSRFFSADMAHGVHPNYVDKHDSHYKVAMNKGPVIKINNNQRYATSAETESYMAWLCAEQKIPYQKYIHRTDLNCGSTIGPISATRLGIPTVDFGNAMLSMHSIRECSGSADHEYSCSLARAFFDDQHSHSPVTGA